MKQGKLLNLKSYDSYVLMQDIFHASLLGSHATKAIELLSDVCLFFKYVCSHSLWRGRTRACSIETYSYSLWVGKRISPNVFHNLSPSHNSFGR